MSTIARNDADADGEFHIPDVNLAQFMVDNMEKYGPALALVDAASGRSYTFSEVIIRVQQLAAGLQDIGLRQGDILSILMFNTIEYPVIMYATNMIGGVLQTISPLFKDENIVRLFKEVKPKFLITSLDHTNRVVDLVNRCKDSQSTDTHFLPKIIVDGDTEDFISYATLFGFGKVTRPADIDPGTTAAILLPSSGTLGASKNVQLSHSNIVANLPQMLHVYRHRPGMVTVVVQAMSHHYGNCGVMSTCLYSGVQMVVLRKYHLESYITLIAKYKADILHLMPPIAAQLVKSPLRTTTDLSSVKFIHSAASPLGTELMKELMKMFNLSFISQMYGLSETGLITGNYDGAFKLGSSGVLTTGTQLKIVDIESGDEVATNKTGEILCKGPQITIGYLNRPETTADAFDNDGFFKTGDVGYVDDDGFLFVIDRVKDMIKYNDKLVPPSYIEDILVMHADVIDAAVIGVPLGETGEVPKAFVEKCESSNVKEDEIIGYVEGQVPDHMRLRGGVEFVKKIPRSPAGKRFRRFLRQYGAEAWKYV